MYLIVRNGNGSHYTSLAFGYYCFITATDNYQRYLEGIHNRYYLVLDAEKRKLIQQYVFDRNSMALNPSVVIVDDDTADWKTDEDGKGCLKFLGKYPPDRIVQEISNEDLQRCIVMDAECHYEPYQVIETQADADRLMTSAGGFHDARISELYYENDTLYVLFDGIWGCRIEVWFSGEVSWNTDSRDPEEYDPYWLCAALIVSDGWICLVDDDNIDNLDIPDNHCWFKARKLKYHIIPDP